MIPELPFARITGVTRTLMTTAGASTSPFTGQQQVQDWGGAWWQYELEFAQTPGDEGRRLAGFFAALGGARGRFLFRDPTIRPLGSVGAPVVAGAGQAGNTLHTSGWDLVADRRNLLRWTEDFGNSVWSKTSGVSVEYGFPDPIGGNTAWRVTFTDADQTVTQNLASLVAAGEQVVGRMWVKGTGGETIRHGLALDLEFNFLLDGEWREILQEGSAGADRRTFNISTWVGATARVVYIWRPQLEYGIEPTPYQAIPGLVARASDFFTLGEGANTRLYQLTQDVTPNGDGNATLHFVPPLREAPPDGAALGVDKPAVLLRPTGPIPANIGLANFYRFSLSAREAI